MVEKEEDPEGIWGCLSAICLWFLLCELLQAVIKFAYEFITKVQP